MLRHRNINALFLERNPPVHTQIISTSERGIDKGPIGICMATAQRMQLVINAPIMVAVVVAHVPIGMRCFARRAASANGCQRKHRDAHNDLTRTRRATADECARCSEWKCGGHLKK